MSSKHPLWFPLYDQETATSFVSRLTRYCALHSPSDLCLDLGFRWQDFVRGDDDLFDLLSDVAGVSPINLKHWAVRTVGRHKYEVCGQRATRTTLARAKLRVCPRCLLMDKQRDGRLGVHRRYHWQFLSIHTCAIHQVPMMALEPAKYTIQNYDFIGQVERHREDIETAAGGMVTREATGFELYLLRRLAGQSNAPFLDAMPMFIASRLCEVLGLVMVYGPGRKISEANETELIEAGKTGFDALKSGKQGLYEALDGLVTPMALRTVCHQSDLGPFFEWIRLSNLGSEIEPLKDMVRDYIFRSYPFREGETVLGKPCPSASQFTIHGAWQSLGVQRHRMNRFLLSEGIAERDDENTVRLKNALSVSEIENLSDQIANRLNSIEARALLNVSVEVLQSLREQGVLCPVIDALDQVPKYERRDLEQILAQMSQHISQKGAKPRGMETIAGASRRLRCPSVEVVELILDGKLATIWRDEAITGLAGYYISLRELRDALPTLEMPGIPKVEATQKLKVTYATISYLIETGLLASMRVRNPKSRQFLTAVCDDSIEAFQAKYETLGQLAKRFRRAPGPFGCHLEAHGLWPVETPKGISWFYEREDLERRLGKLGFKAPECASEDA